MPQQSPRHRPPVVKTEPGHASNAAVGPTQTDAASDINGSQASSTNYDGASGTLRPDQSFYYRGGRSDAPTPSERLGEPEPLLRELRMRPNPLAMESPTGVDESSNFHSSFQDIGKKLKACNDTLGELQGLGVSHDVPLPELVLVGDQSAGKSSVMSGLANLDLPRSEGTCTRCPLHIRVSWNSDWSCRVSLSKEYSYQPPADREIDERDVTDQDPFFPWRKLHSIRVSEFKTVHDKNEIEEVLRWAQVAILNDDKNYELFVPGSGPIARQTTIDQASQETAAKFSPNVVFLEIKGPELPNLSFYDMPGIFQNPADAKDEYLVNVVRNLSENYIKRESAIIMCSMPMNTDAENSFTFGLARKLGASSRTIGVLTKADLLSEAQGSNHNQWLGIMNGNSHQTGLGYFITSRPQGKDLDELKSWEEAMFDAFTVDNWPQSFHHFAEQCGVEKLKAFLSQKLGEQFIKSLPNIEHKVKMHLNEINDQLDTLPELPHNVELEIRSSLSKFTSVAATKLDAFVKHLNPLPQDFKKCILHIKPKFVLKDSSDIPVVDISDNDSDGSTTTVNRQTPHKRRSMAPPATPAKRQRTPALNGNGLFVKAEASSHAGSPAPRRPQKDILPQPFTQFSAVGSGFRTLRQVREEILQKTRSGMPNVIPEEVYESLVLKSMEPWNRPMFVFLGEIMHRLSNELGDALMASFGGLQKRIIFHEAQKHLEGFLQAHQNKMKDEMLQLYHNEIHALLTYDNESFDRYVEDDHRTLTRFRHQKRMETKGLLDPGPLEDWNEMNEARRAEDTKRRLDDIAKIGRDQFQREVEVVAYVRGYYRLAGLRFVDNITQCVLCRMIPSIKDELSLYLDRQLGLVSCPDMAVFERLMEEDPHIASRREALKREKTKFEQAVRSIAALNAGAIDGGDAASVIYTGSQAPDVSMTDAVAQDDI